MNFFKKIGGVLSVLSLFFLIAIVLFGIALSKKESDWKAEGIVLFASNPIRAQKEGVIATLGPSVGEEIEKGALLFSILGGNLEHRHRELRQHIAMGEQALQDKRRESDLSMGEYIQSLQEIELGVGSQGKLEQTQFLFEKIQREAEALEETIRGLQEALSRCIEEQEKLCQFSPFPGVIASSLKEVGDSVTQGEVVYLLVDSHRYWVEVDLDPTIVCRMEKGRPVSLFFQSMPEKRWKGTLSWISPVPSEGGGYLGRIEIVDGGFPARHNLPVGVVISLTS